MEGKLLSNSENKSYVAAFGKDKENNAREEKFHYPMKKYYIKLTSIKGQFDGAFINGKEIKIEEFPCDIIYKNFEIILEKREIFFQFKNRSSGAKKIMDQAFKYQINGKIFLNKKDKDQNYFFHIIIIRAKALEDLLKEYINKNKATIQELNNFTILCLKDSVIDNNIIYNNISISSGSSKLGGNKKSIENRIGGIENRIDEIENRIDNLEKDVSTIKDSIGSINKTLENLA